MQELLQSVFKYAVEQGYVKQNPAIGLEKIKQNRRVRPLNKSGLRKLIKVIEKQEDVVLRGAFLMLIYGFAPRSKIFSMAWDDLDFNHVSYNEDSFIMQLDINNFEIVNYLNLGELGIDFIDNIVYLDNLYVIKHYYSLGVHVVKIYEIENKKKLSQ